MDTAWIQVFVLTLSECVAPAGKTICQEQAFELDYGLNPRLWLIGCIAGAAVVGFCGTLATKGAVKEPPVTVDGFLDLGVHRCLQSGC